MKVAIDNRLGYGSSGSDFIHRGCIKSMEGKLLDGSGDNNLSTVGGRESGRPSW
jgi:hypothetical protein